MNAEAKGVPHINIPASLINSDRVVDRRSFIVVSMSGNDKVQQEEKHITWKSRPQKERDEKRRRFETWVKTKLSPEERNKLLAMFKDKRITDKEFRDFVETLFKKHGKPA